MIHVKEQYAPSYEDTNMGVVKLDDKCIPMPSEEWGGNWEESWWEENVWWPIWRAWRWLLEIPTRIKYFYQRGKRGYADEDCWAIDWYLSSWLPDALETMINKKKGGGNSYPGVGKANTSQKWNAIVRDIAEGFRADYQLKNSIINPTTIRGRRLVEKRKKGFALFIKWYDYLWD